MSAKLTITTPLALFVARRSSGKTHFQIHLLYVLSKGGRFKWILVISPTSFNHEWSDIVGEANVLPVFDPEQVETLMQRQADLREDGVKGVAGSGLPSDRAAALGEMFLLKQQ